jgi:hypothetical protein
LRSRVCCEFMVSVSRPRRCIHGRLSSATDRQAASQPAAVAIAQTVCESLAYLAKITPLLPIFSLGALAIASVVPPISHGSKPDGPVALTHVSEVPEADNRFVSPVGVLPPRCDRNAERADRRRLRLGHIITRPKPIGRRAPSEWEFWTWCRAS